MTSHEGFDRAARDAHAASLDALSPRVRAQLAQRRRAVLAADASPRPSHARWGWMGATAAMACVLVLALQVRPAVEPVAQPPRALATVQADATDPGGLLAEDPDFYLWLASSDAPAYAVE